MERAAIMGSHRGHLGLIPLTCATAAGQRCMSRELFTDSCWKEHARGTAARSEIEMFYMHISIYMYQYIYTYILYISTYIYVTITITIMKLLMK